MNEINNIIEVLLFVSSEPLSEGRIKNVLNDDRLDVNAIIDTDLLDNWNCDVWFINTSETFTIDTEDGELEIENQEFYGLFKIISSKTE